MQHIVNDVKVLQNIRHTCKNALSIAPHGNLGPTLLRHQITGHLLQHVKILSRSFQMTLMVRGDGSVCIQDTHIPGAVLEATRASTPFGRVSGRVIEFRSI